MEDTVCNGNFKWKWRIFSQNQNLPFADCDMAIFVPKHDNQDRTFNVKLSWKAKKNVHSKQKQKCFNVEFDPDGWVNYEFEYKESSGVKWKIHCRGQIFASGKFTGTYRYAKNLIDQETTTTEGEQPFSYTIPNRGVDLDGNYFSD